MNNLESGLLSVLRDAITEYATSVSEKFEIDLPLLEELWNNSCDSFKIKLEKRATKKEPSEKKTTSLEKKEGICLHVSKEGNQCQVKPRKGASWCSKHKKHEKSPPVKKTPMLRMNKDIGMYWHPESEMVFKSKDEKYVIGKLENKKVQPLNDSDIERCKELGFQLQVKPLSALPIEEVLEKVLEEED